MNMVHGGAVEKRQIREDGQFSINVTAEAQQHSPLFTGLGAAPRVLLTHGDSVTTVAPGFQVTARSHELIVAAIEDRSRGLYGVQFHPEVDLTECGSALLRNFLFNIAGCTGTFTPVSRQELAMQYIRRSVDDRSKVLVLVSGGVDSSVCAALLKAALPADRIIALHIDNGFMRLNESNLVVESLRALGLNLTCIDATHNFAEARTKLKDEAELSERLCDSVRPEVKRQIIGDTFVHVANQAIAQLGLNAADVYLAQGTLRPDLIESANAAVSANADVIKTVSLFRFIDFCVFQIWIH
jgi:GMP synthase (glutamine-hydrolysing)